MITRKIMPNGWPCTLAEAPPGPFVTVAHPDDLCFKSEYRHDDGRAAIAYNSAGEFYCGEGDATMVQPVVMIIVDDEE